MSEIRVRIIGESAIEGGGRQIRPKADVLFALALLLTVERGRRLPRSEVRAMLWPRESEDRAQHSLRQMLYKLRGMGLAVSDTSGGLSVATTGVWVDFMDGDPEADPRLRDALLMPSGVSILPGFTVERSQALTDWVDQVRSRAEGAVRGHLLGRIAAARQAGRWDQMEHAARNCLQVDPLNEAATQALAEAMALAGSKVSAVRLIEEYNDEVASSTAGIALPTNLIRKRVLEELAAGAPTPDGHPLVEREFHLTELWRLTVESKASTAATVNIHGPSGIGKSALLAEFRRLSLLHNISSLIVPCTRSEADNSAIVTSALAVGLIDRRGAAGATPAAYAIVQRAASGPSDNATMSPATSLAAILTALGEVITAVAEESFFILAFDDLDGTTNEFREWLAATAATAPPNLRILSTSRSPLIQPSGLRQSQISLPPLSEAGIDTLYRRRAKRSPTSSELSELRITTGGVPVYVSSALESRAGRANAGVTGDTFARHRISLLSRQEQLVLLAASNMAPHGVVADLDSVFPDEPMTVAECVDSLCQQALLELAPSSTNLVVHPLWSEAIRRHSSRATLALVASRTARALSTPNGAPADALRRQWRSMELVAQSGHPEQLVEATLALATQLDALGHCQAAAILLATSASDCRDTTASQELMRGACVRFASLSDWASFHRHREFAGDSATLSGRHFSPQDAELAIADLEYAHLHNAGDGGVLRQILELVKGGTLYEELALRLLLSAALTADSWCNRTAIAEIALVLEDYVKVGSASNLAKQISVVVDTSLGNFDRALEVAMGVFAHFDASRKYAEASRAARWCTFPLRHAGNFEECATWATRALLLARAGGNLWLEAQALDTLATMQLEQGKIDEAELLVDNLVKTGIPALAPRYKAEVAELHVRISFHRRRYAEAIHLADEELNEHRVRTPRTEGMLLTWLLLASCAVSETTYIQSTTARLLDLWNKSLEGVGGFDASASALFHGLTMLGDEDTARRLLERYLEKSRTRKDDFHLVSI